MEAARPGVVARRVVAAPEAAQVAVVRVVAAPGVAAPVEAERRRAQVQPGARRGEPVAQAAPIVPQ
jgi:hypothetical protein